MCFSMVRLFFYCLSLQPITLDVLRTKVGLLGKHTFNNIFLVIPCEDIYIGIIKISPIYQSIGLDF